MRIGILAHKLSFASDFRQAGVSRYIEYLLRYLPESLDPGDEAHVFAGPEAREPERIASFDRSLIWHWSRLPTGKAPVRIAWEQTAAPILSRVNRLDVVHGPVNVTPLVGAPPAIVTVHDLAFLRFPQQYPSLQRRYLAALTRWSVRRSALTLAVSEHTRADVIEFFGAAPERVVAVPHGVSEDFQPRQGTEELAQFRAHRGLPETFVLFVGTLQPRKNLEGLLRAYARIDPSDRAPLVVVGSPGWKYQSIYEELTRSGLERDVIFAGYADSAALRLWYSAAAVFVYPSLYEGFGLPVLEAMACGTPVITSTASSLPEVAGDSAITVDPADPDALAEALTRLLGDRDLQLRLRERGLARVRSFSWRTTVERTVALYRQVRT
jgi:glycosyltransferase involved in cell wall biosynthesis